MLLQLEQECLDIYRRKVEKTRKYKADLHQQLAEAETEIAGIASALGEGFSSFSRVGFCGIMGFIFLKFLFHIQSGFYYNFHFNLLSWIIYLLIVSVGEGKGHPQGASRCHKTHS